MTPPPLLPTRRRALRTLAAGLAAALSAGAAASPGAHGPNGEHLDAPAAASATAAGPRLESHSELFEVSAGLEHGVFAFFVARYATNEAVLGATIEVESGARKAAALFRPEQGDYVIEDPAMLGELASEGKHALLFTITAGTDSDLLEGTLPVSRATDAGGGATQAWAVWMPAAAIIGLGASWMARRRRLGKRRPPAAGRTQA